MRDCRCSARSQERWRERKHVSFSREDDASLTLLFCCCFRAMSFLYFDRNSRSSFTARLENGQEEEASIEDVSAANDSHLYPPSTASSRDSGRNDESSFGLRSDASLTDHEVVVGFPPGTLVEIYRQRQQGEEEDESHGATILSSAPSNDAGDLMLMFPTGPREPQEQQQQQHVTSPVSQYPPLPVGSILSLSTTESQWRSPENSGAKHEDPASSTSDLSFSPIDLPSLSSTMFHSMSDQSSISSSDNAMVLREGRTAFRNVADRLALQQQGNNGGEWFSRFTEQDWINFRIQAQVVLQALEQSSSSPPALALPPPVPALALEHESTPRTVEDFRWNDYLPSEFICSLCQDPIVGATTLSCACEKSTACTKCWEEYSTVIVESDDSPEFVQVERRSDCPSCGGHVQSTVPCHAMDMAIFHAAKNIPSSLRRAYYTRLAAWRGEVLARRSGQQTRQQQHDAHRQDLILAELIQQEEELIWKKQSRNNAYSARSQRALLFLGEVTMYVAVASLSAVGITVLARRN